MKVLRPDIRKARIEIIPMIDTIFFLLVYFLFVVLSMVKMQAMEVSIPKPSPPSTAQPPPRCIVKVDSGGNFYVNKELVNGDSDSVAYAVQAQINKNPNTLVIVSVDPTSKVQPLIICLDGVNKVSKPDSSPVNTIINGQGGVNLPV